MKFKKGFLTFALAALSTTVHMVEIEELFPIVPADAGAPGAIFPGTTHLSEHITLQSADNHCFIFSRETLSGYWEALSRSFNLNYDAIGIPSFVNVDVSRNVLYDIKTFIDFQEHFCCADNDDGVIVRFVDDPQGPLCYEGNENHRGRFEHVFASTDICHEPLEHVQGLISFFAACRSPYFEKSTTRFFFPDFFYSTWTEWFTRLWNSRYQELFKFNKNLFEERLRQVS